MCHTVTCRACYAREWRVIYSADSYDAYPIRRDTFDLFLKREDYDPIETMAGFKTFKLVTAGDDSGRICSLIYGRPYETEICRNGVRFIHGVPRDQITEFYIPSPPGDVKIERFVQAGFHVEGVARPDADDRPGVVVPASPGSPSMSWIHGESRLERMYDWAAAILARDIGKNAFSIPVVFTTRNIRFVGQDCLSVLGLLIPSQRALTRDKDLLIGIAIAALSAVSGTIDNELLEAIISIQMNYIALRDYFERLRDIYLGLEVTDSDTVEILGRDYGKLEFYRLVIGAYLYRVVHGIRLFYQQLVDIHFTDRKGVVLDSVDPALTLKKLDS